MKIGNINNSGKAQGSGKAKRSKSGAGVSFSGHVVQSGDDNIDDVSALTAEENVHASSTLSGLLGIQEVKEHKENKGDRAAQHGAEQILERLEDLRIQILTGNIDNAALDNIAQLTQQELHKAESPALQGILRDIELRARVELAKHKQANK